MLLPFKSVILTIGLPKGKDPPHFAFALLLLLLLLLPLVVILQRGGRDLLLSLPFPFSS